MNVKRIFLITIDCLRADHVGCMGGEDLTPNIDRLARDSLIFTRTFANGPATPQSFPAILTSTYFLMHRESPRLSPLFTTLAELLAKQGFKTAAFHSNPFLSGKLGWNRGFIDFYDFLTNLKFPLASLIRDDWAAKTFRVLIQRTKMSHNKKLLDIIRKLYYKLFNFQIPYVEAKVLNNHIIDWLNKNKSESFFIWIHYMDPHEPFIPPDDYLESFGFRSRKEAYIFNIDSGLDPPIEQIKTLKKLYELEVRYVDSCIGELIDFLEMEGLLDSSLMILTADHGQEFKEHGNFGHLPHSLYNEVLHVPLIIYGLDRVGIIDSPVQLLDIPPTISEILNIKAPKTFMGKSMLSAEGDSPEPIFSESAESDLNNLRYNFDRSAIACIYGNWKIIINGITGKVELYNLEKDQKETTNLIEEESEIVDRLTSLVINHLRREHLIMGLIRRVSKLKNKRNLYEKV